MLIERGARPGALDLEGLSPLSLAMRMHRGHGDPKMIKLVEDALCAEGRM